MLGCFGVVGQKKFDLTLSSSSLDLGEKQIDGISSAFDFTRDEVRKGWWKYAKRFGSPLDMRTYYEVKIPASLNEGNVDLKVFAQSIESGDQTDFKIGMAEDQYKTQAEALLKAFKKDFYIQYYLNEIKVIELEAAKYSGQYESAIDGDEKERLLSSIEQVKLKVEQLKEEIRKVELVD